MIEESGFDEVDTKDSWDELISVNSGCWAWSEPTSVGWWFAEINFGSFILEFSQINFNNNNKNL